MPTYISEVKYRGPANNDFIEVVTDAGADVSGLSIVVYHPNGNIRSTDSLGTSVNTIAGKDVYLVNTGVHKDGAVALVDNGTVVAFISFDSVVTPSSGPAAGLSSTQVGSTGNNQNESLVSTDGVTYSNQTPDGGTIPCFLRGTLIQTASGDLPVESLAPGMKVARADGGTAVLRWKGHVQVGATGPDAEANAPYVVPRGAFGRNCPRKDTYLSPNHRVSLSDPAFELLFEANEVLIPVKHLAGWAGIHQDRTVKQPEYYHLLFDSHEVIVANGLASESLHPGEIAVDGFSRETRDELYRLFPELADDPMAYGQTARRCLKSFESEIVHRALGA